MSQPWTHVPHSPAYPRVDEHYVEPLWCSKRLFEEEPFTGQVYDPACGFGRIILAATRSGLNAFGTDIVDRGQPTIPLNFFYVDRQCDNVVSNPPFDVFEKFTRHALKTARRKVALIMPTARLNAARWLEDTPLRRVWLMTPRPSMPPGHVIKAGGKVGGGKSDYCWLVFEHGHRGGPTMHWMHRDVV